MPYDTEHKIDEIRRMLEELESESDDDFGPLFNQVSASLSGLSNALESGEVPSGSKSIINMDITPGSWELGTICFKKREDVLDTISNVLWPSFGPSEDGMYRADLIGVQEGPDVRVIAFMQHGGNTDNNADFICGSANELQKHLKSKLGMEGS